jgi:Zn-finger nucleic acid-binding protein
MLAEVSMLECRACDGVWIGASDFERICSDREAPAAVLARPRPASSDRTGQTPVRYRPCVVCGKMVNRVNFGRLSGTVIDVCRGHGAFLDSGELHAIATFVMEGGLDRARQREKEDLEEERRRLEILRTTESIRARSSERHH